MFCLLTVPSEAPLNLIVNATDSTTLVGSWNPPSLEHQNGQILAYTVNLTLIAKGGVQVTNREVQMLRTPNTSLFVRSLHPFYTYSFTVAAVNSVGTGPSSTVTIMMPEAGEN